MHRLAKPAYWLCRYRGFESLPLRQQVRKPLLSLGLQDRQVLFCARLRTFCAHGDLSWENCAHSSSCKWRSKSAAGGGRKVRHSGPQIPRRLAGVNDSFV